jgi:hypothetical protein
VKSFTVRVTDAANPRQSDTQQLSIRVVRGPTELRVDPVLIQTKASTGMFNLGLKVGVVSATLKGGAPAEPIANALVVFKVNKFTVCTGRTNSAGKVTCKMSAIGTAQAILRGKVTGTYAGNGNWLPSSGDALLAGKDE